MSSEHDHDEHLVAPVIELTEHLKPAILERLENFNQRALLSPYGAWCVAHELKESLWTRLAGHLEPEVFTTDNHYRSLFVVWPTANPWIRAASVTSNVGRVFEPVDPADHVRVFQLAWGPSLVTGGMCGYQRWDVSGRYAVILHDSRGWRHFEWDLQSVMGDRGPWYEISDHCMEPPSQAAVVDFSHPPRALDKLIMFVYGV